MLYMLYIIYIYIYIYIYKYIHIYLAHLDHGEANGLRLCVGDLGAERVGGGLRLGRPSLRRPVRLRRRHAEGGLFIQG